MLNELKENRKSIGQLLGMSLSIFKQNIVSISLITVIFFFPIAIIMNLISDRSFGVLNILNSNMASGVVPDLGMIGQAWLYLLALLLVTLLIKPIGDVAVAMIVKKSLNNEEVRYGKILLAAFEKGPIIISAGFIYGICVTICFMLIIPGIILATIWYFYTVAIAVDDLGSMDSLKKSQTLVKGKWWSTFGILLFVGLICETVAAALLLILNKGGQSFAIGVTYSVCIYFIQAFVVVFITLLYYNRSFMINKNMQE